MGQHGSVSEISDVYNFGVFLLELVTGREAALHNFPLSNQSIAQWVCRMHIDSSAYIFGEANANSE